MPKVIENLQQTILKHSKQLLLESGYAAFTMRAAARRCEIAVGTLYNYFSSKDELIGCIMLEDWQEDLANVKDVCIGASNLEEGLEALYNGVVNFSRTYREIWSAYGFTDKSGVLYAQRHQKLVCQIIEALSPLLEKEKGLPPQTDIFLAENILICAGNSKLEFSSFSTIVKKIL